MVTPWKDFVRSRAIAELFGGANMPLDVRGPIGNQLFATGWGKDRGWALRRAGHDVAVLLPGGAAKATRPANAQGRR